MLWQPGNDQNVPSLSPSTNILTLAGNGAVAGPLGEPLRADLLLAGADLLFTIVVIAILVSMVRRSRSDRSARDKADFLQTIVDAVPIPLFFKDAAGRYLGCNRSFEESIGKSRQEIVGRTVYEVAPSDLAAVYHQADLELISRQGEQAYEAAVLFADGQRHNIMFHKAVFRNPGGEVGGLVGTMFDVSQRREAEQAVLEGEERYRAFIAMSTEGIWRGDLVPPVPVSLPVTEQVASLVEHLRVAECNDALARIYGFSRADEMTGRRLREFYDLPQLQEVLAAFVHNGYSLSDFETRQFDRHGRPIWLASSVIGVVEGGVVTRLWGTRRDISESKRQLADLEFQANHDTLTGLPNRFQLKHRLGLQLDALAGEGGQLALFIMDLDRFKEVNDTLGHHAGDQLLCEIGSRLGHVVTGLGGEMARLGGDEFAIVFSRLRDKREASWLADIVVRAMQSPFDVEGLKVEVTASLGIALAPGHGRTTSSLLRCADVAMYQAKQEVKRHCLYDPDRDPYTPERLALLSDLGAAVRRDELVLHFQPKIHLADGSLAGFEALVRWQHPHQGLLMPGEFIPFAEIGELIVPLTYRVIEKAVQQLHHWQCEGFSTTLACNLSPRLLMDDDLPRHLEGFLAHYQVEPAALELEITETALIAEPERAREILLRIHAMGVRLSIDDFGTGYSSLALLKRLPLHALKIDLLFVSQMLHSEQDAIIVSSTVNLAHNLGLSIVAEGVENAGIQAALRELGCDEAQGYHIGRPMTVEEVKIWLAADYWLPVGDRAAASHYVATA
jgi:diguanylate cyclase (GGDEF)-like protein/PAS domain S-box-containing protein